MEDFGIRKATPLEVRAQLAFRERNADLICVDVPELSEGLDEPVKCYFKRDLNMEEYLEYHQNVGSCKNELHMFALSNATLFSLCLCDENGEPLVTPMPKHKNLKGKEVVENHWTVDKISGKLVQELAVRAKLHEEVIGPLDLLKAMLPDKEDEEDSLGKKDSSSSSIKSPTEAEEPSPKS